jgi:hypothetical protein
VSVVNTGPPARVPAEPAWGGSRDRAASASEACRRDAAASAGSVASKESSAERPA